jgi:hypothetical protein
MCLRKISAGAEMWRKVPVEVFSRGKDMFPLETGRQIVPKRKPTGSIVLKPVERRAMTIQD